VDTPITTLFPPAYGHPVPSPDGFSLAWISDRDGRPRAWVAALPGAEQTVDEPGWALPTGPDDTVPGDVTELSWSPDGYWLACQLAPGGGERTRVRIVRPDGSQLRDLAPDAAAATLGPWSPNGRQLGITIFTEGGGDGYACLVDVRDHTSTVLARGPAAKVCAISGDGRRAVVRLGRRGARSLQLIDLRSGLHTDLVPGGGATVAEARFGVTGDVLYVHTDAGREHAALLAVSLLGDGEPALVHLVAERVDADLDLVALDPAGARAALVWNVAGYSECELLDLRSGLTTALPETAGEVVSDAAFTRDGRALLVAAEAPAAAPRISRVALDDGGAVTLLLGVDGPAGAVVPALHTYPAEDGLALSGWLFRPRTALGPLPTLIWLHGGPEAQERPVFQPLFQALVAHGVAVFAPNVRGSGGYGRSFSCADDHERRFAAVTDVRATTGYLVDAGAADPARLGVAGRSYGGYLTLMALTWFPELFRVGVDVCGMSDFATFYAHTEPWIAEAATGKYGDPDRDAALLDELSPLRRIDRLVAPLLVVHGRHDTNVPLVEARQLLAALRERGEQPAFLLFDDEGHEVRGRENRVRFVREVLDWVTGHLLEIGEQTA
jgi:dipeptidyl aminopeptidase/acylaminoacyl peptidase